MGKHIQNVVVSMALCLTSLTVAPGCNQPLASDDLMVDTQAPGFTLGRLGGGRVSLSDYRGKVVLLAFWGAG